jgi:hypothetical protein
VSDPHRSVRATFPNQFCPSQKCPIFNTNLRAFVQFAGLFIARSLLGVIFVVFGSNMFLHFIPMPPPSEGPARDFMTTLFVSHYLYVVGACRSQAAFCCSQDAGCRWA